MEILWEALFIFVLRVMGIARKYTCRAGFLPAGQFLTRRAVSYPPGRYGNLPYSTNLRRADFS